MYLNSRREKRTNFENATSEKAFDTVSVKRKKVVVLVLPLVWTGGDLKNRTNINSGGEVDETHIRVQDCQVAN